MRILLIEPDRHIREVTVDRMRQSHYQVDAVFDGLDGYHYLISDLYDVVILNYDTPSMSGEEIIRRVRHEGHHTPIITFSQNLDSTIIPIQEEFDEVYVVSPFTIETVLSRVHAVRRVLQQEDAGTITQIGNVECNRKTGELCHQDKTIQLTSLELQLLNHLLSNRKSTVSKRQLIQVLWGDNTKRDDNNVEVYISFLRKKLRLIDANVKINTTRNVGYSLRIVKE